MLSSMTAQEMDKSERKRAGHAVTYPPALAQPPPPPSSSAPAHCHGAYMSTSQSKGAGGSHIPPSQWSASSSFVAASKPLGGSNE